MSCFCMSQTPSNSAEKTVLLLQENLSDLARDRLSDAADWPSAAPTWSERQGGEIASWAWTSRRGPGAMPTPGRAAHVAPAHRTNSPGVATWARGAMLVTVPPGRNPAGYGHRGRRLLIWPTLADVPAV
jgi:hypothetical protein